MHAIGLLFVLYTGIVGSDAERVDSQVGSLLAREAGATRIKVMSLDSRKILARHQGSAGAIVRALSTDGVIAGELTRTKEGRILHLVVYGGDGRRKDILEIPLSGDALDKEDLVALRANFVPDVVALVQEPEPQPVKPKPVKPPVKPKPVPKPTPTEPPPEVEIVEDEPPPPEPEPVAKQAPTPVEDQMPSPPIMADGPHLGIEAAIGFGVATRSFSPGPPSIIGYASPAVATVRFEATLHPRPFLMLDLSAERSLSMSTQIGTDVAATQMQRWEITGGIDLLRKPLRIAALLGLGQRMFTIESKSSDRTPDGTYTYLNVGAEASVGGRSLRVVTDVILQPVTGDAGTTPDMLATEFGSARRWGVDLEILIDWRPIASMSALFVRPRLSYQRFSWSFPDAGARGSGGAVDNYLLGGLSLGMSY